MSRRFSWVLVGLVVLAVVAFGLAKTTLHRSDTTVNALFASTIGLYPGSDVEILGVPVGKVTSIKPVADKVRVTMTLDHDQSVAASTGAVIIAPTLVSDRFVQLTEPYDGGARFTSGATIPADRTAVPVEIDDLYSSLTNISDELGPKGANKNGALSQLLDVAAKNLKGNGADLNSTFRELSKATATLNNSDDDFFATISNLNEFNDMLVANDRGVGQVNRQFAAVTQYLAADRADLAAAVQNLGGALGVVDDFIRDNRGSLKGSVDQLIGPTKTLVNQKESLAEAVRDIPLLMQNFLKAYNVDTNTIDGRGNLNELTVWSKDGLVGQTSAEAPPTMLGTDSGR